jgi:UDP-N-acetylmuramate dehydrogenase
MSASPVQTTVDLQALNTLRLPCRPQAYWRLESIDALHRLARLAASDGPLADLPRPWYVLGGGSNLLLPAQLQGTVLHMAVMGREQLPSPAPDLIRLRVAAGESWHALVAWTVQQGWRGLENLALIPGTVGAAPVQNIGAYGLEVGERIESVEVLDLQSGKVSQWSGVDCRFAYRDSRFRQEPGRWLIVAVVFALDQTEALRLDYPDLARQAGLQAKATPQSVFEAVCAIRRAKLPDPAQIGNVGSFFKNPIVEPELARALQARFPGLVSYRQADGRFKLAAAWLIDQCGWRGRWEGPVGVHERQALVLLHRGGGTLTDVLALADRIRADVLARYGVSLEIEPLQWP